MMRELPITSRQATLLLAAQSAVDKAQRELDLIAQAILAGHDTPACQIVSVDSDKNILTVEILEGPA